MAERPLEVIALISGGKDSIYSLLHCLEQGHRVIALGNLYPPATAAPDLDLNSHMFQTVGYDALPHLARALDIPLYRRPIFGREAARKGTVTEVEDGRDQEGGGAANGDGDDFKSMIPLLQAIMEAHRSANAVCSGAIASDYQRTRVESVALGLGLIPLAYLWKYPTLPPASDPISLLRDMATAGLDVLVIRVAGAPVRILGDRLTDSATIDRLLRENDEWGPMLGEGGEYETLVLNGPRYLFKERLHADWSGMGIVDEGGGNMWIRVAGVTTLPNGSPNVPKNKPIVRIPDLLEESFHDSLRRLELIVEGPHASSDAISVKASSSSSTWGFHESFSNKSQIIANGDYDDIEAEMEDILHQMQKQLEREGIDKSHVVFTIILLDDMKVQFTRMNEAYKKFFDRRNPPARVTIACGPGFLPSKKKLLVQYTCATKQQVVPQAELKARRGLHVQSRSYWAPANIGPYSQAHAIELSDRDPTTQVVYIAGQIGLDPATTDLPAGFYSDTKYGPVELPAESEKWRNKFHLQTVLALQHLWRIGREMEVDCWTGAVAYLPRADGHGSSSFKAKLAGIVWEHAHSVDSKKNSLEEEDKEEGEDEDEDENGQRLDDSLRRNYAYQMITELKPIIRSLPNRSNINVKALPSNQASQLTYVPPFFAAEVYQLPKNAAVEWHSLLGLRGSPISVYSNQSTAGTVHEWTTPSSQDIYITLMLPKKPHDNEMPRDAQEALEMLTSLGSSYPWKQLLDVESNAFSEGYYGSYASWIDASVEAFWSAASSTMLSYGGVIPCQGIFDKEERRLAAVLQFRVGRVGGIRGK